MDAKAIMDALAIVESLRYKTIGYEAIFQKLLRVDYYLQKQLALAMEEMEMGQ